MSQYSAQLSAITRAVTDSHTGWDLAGGDGPSPLQEYLDALKEEVEQVTFLLHHECKYGENDYCIFCGRDGRV